LKEGLLFHRDRFAIPDLTIYEVGNAVWRAYRREAIKQPVLVARMFEEVLKGLEKLSVGPVLFEVLDNVARREGLKLVTKDSDLLKFPEAISLKAMLKELKS
jgi:predicted nucleic acid-binding protein